MTQIAELSILGGEIDNIRKLCRTLLFSRTGGDHRFCHGPPTYSDTHLAFQEQLVRGNEISRAGLNGARE